MISSSRLLPLAGTALLTALSFSSLSRAQTPAAQAAAEGEADVEEGVEEQAATDAETEAPAEASVDGFKMPVDRMAEHYLGSASRPVRFDWRRSPIILGAHASELLERNNFGSLRVGGMVRYPLASFVIEGAASYVFVFGTESSQLLALTPYRQRSRPARIEIDVNGSYPLFEGVVTPIVDFIPPAQMVLSGTAGLRYLLYTENIAGDRDWRTSDTWTNLDTWREIGEGLATAQLLDRDQARLERTALGGMAIDPATVHTLVGLTFDTYLQPGFFISSRALLAVPLLAPVSGTRLGFWWEMSLATGWAF